MLTFAFAALGTAWTILVDAAQFSEELQKTLLLQTQNFEEQYSRFISTSETVSFRSKPGGDLHRVQRFGKDAQSWPKLKKVN
jgi:hypothetical protein